jgi:hypothetical protein
MRDNADLQDRTQQLEHLILQLQSETDTIGKKEKETISIIDLFFVSIGDYIYLYQQQRQQLHRRYQEKDDYIKQLSHDRLDLQVKNHLFILHQFPMNIHFRKNYPSWKPYLCVV